MKKLSVLWIALLLVAGAVVTGCGSSSDNTTGSGGGSTQESEAEGGGGEAEGGSSVVSEAQAATKEAETIPTEILATTPVKPKAGSTIFHVACDLSLEGCANQAKGLKSAVEAIGFKYEQCNGGSSPETISSCFKNAVNAHPDVIIPNGIGIEGAGEGFAAAKKAGIPIVGMFTGDPPGAEGVATEVAGETCPEEGKSAANWVIANSEGKANVVFVGTQTYTCNKQRQEGFMDQMKTCSECKASTLTFSIATMQSSLPQQLQAELQSNSEIEYMVGTFDAVSLAAAEAIRQAGKTEQIQVGGFDANGPNLEMIRNDEIQKFDVTSGTTEPGWVAADAAARVINGEELEPSTPVTTVMVTAENIEQIGEAYAGAEGFEEQFKKLWGK
ncbi:MAG TPA: sugar ABC transporter substrate-binding protein [Solirubrobacterales bacterium]|nr:sugar ABC transporter substrate-binding protein [Solirubrobacterales bacterium]